MIMLGEFKERMKIMFFHVGMKIVFSRVFKNVHENHVFKKGMKIMFLKVGMKIVFSRVFKTVHENHVFKSGDENCVFQE